MKRTVDWGYVHRPGENREWRNEKRLNFWQRAFRHVRFAKLFMFTGMEDDFLLLLFKKHRLVILEKKKKKNFF